MKSFLLLILISAIYSGAHAQQLVKTEYYNEHWEIADADDFYYQRLIFKENDTLFVIKDLIRGKRLDMLGYAKSIDPIVEHGTCTFYGKKDKPMDTYLYKNGELFSARLDNGRKPVNLDYDFKLEYAIREDDIEASRVKDSIEVFGDEMAPSYPGGIMSFRMDVAIRLHYPYTALKYKKEGTVYVQMIIDTDGKAQDIKIVKSVYKDLDKEAVRAVRLCNKWSPGTKGGKPVKVQLTFPVNFVTR